ncbi:DUF7144 family membrane protein [Amycolatopsis taiwanensis]|uniref:DUF7144 family membrane protein n=1 Tax=Amycolatopsis taiwanensis TaxID=342230 RepID=UPI0004810D25|nr:hypothetical protein [Amycolatopsis taiwanensis]
MPLADKVAPAPREVRVAGLITALLGVALLVLDGVLLASPSATGSNVLAEAGFYALFAIAVLMCGVGLAAGHTWARSPGVVLALMTIGVGWYLALPSEQPAPGVPLIAVGVLVLVLLFRQPSRAWALGQHADETEEEAAERGGLEGRRREREGSDDPES